MGPINLVFILLIQYLGLHSLLSMEAHRSHMLYLHVVLYMDLLEQFLKFHNLVVGVLVQGVGMQVLVLILISQRWRIPTASHLWEDLYHNLDMFLIWQFREEIRLFGMDSLWVACHRTFWVMISRARDHMYLIIMLLTFQHRLHKVDMVLIMLLREHKEDSLGAS
nr:hypothetical protein POPTR_001G148100 [Ipomoea batatas]